jgi:pyruvate kinase
LVANSDWQHIGIAARSLAEATGADGIIAITRSGLTAEVVSNSKPQLPIYTFTNKIQTYKKLSLIGATRGFHISSLGSHDKAVAKVVNRLKKEFPKNTFKKFVLVSGIRSKDYSDAIEIINI